MQAPGMVSTNALRQFREQNLRMSKKYLIQKNNVIFCVKRFLSVLSTSLSDRVCDTKMLTNRSNIFKLLKIGVNMVCNHIILMHTWTRSLSIKPDNQIIFMNIWQQCHSFVYIIHLHSSIHISMNANMVFLRGYNLMCWNNTDKCTKKKKHYK